MVVMILILAVFQLTLYAYIFSVMPVGVKIWMVHHKLATMLLNVITIFISFAMLGQGLIATATNFVSSAGVGLMLFIYERTHNVPPKRSFKQRITRSKPRPQVDAAPVPHEDGPPSYASRVRNHLAYLLEPLYK
jgi:hypothetical protein